MIPRKLTAIIAFWRRRQYGGVPVIDGQGKIVNESLSLPEIDETEITVPRICNESLSLAVIDGIELSVPRICNESLTVPESQEGQLS